MDLFEPFWFLFIGVGARLDGTILWHVLLYSVALLPLVPLYAWVFRLGKAPQPKGMRMFAFAPRVFIEINRASLIAWLVTTIMIAFVVEFEQGLDFIINRESFFDILDFGIPAIVNLLIFRIWFKRLPWG